MKVIIENTVARVESTEATIPLDKLLGLCTPHLYTGGILPNRVKAILSQGPVTVWVYEQPPSLQRFRWIATDSPKPYGPGTVYRDVRIALPYLVLMSVFHRDNKGMPNLLLKDEAFFGTQPLQSVNDTLFYPALLNCSKFADPNRVRDNHPLSWVCTQYLKRTNKMSSRDPMERYQAAMEAVRYCLLETGFNLSSEHNEGNSWYGYSKDKLPDISTIEKWEENTRKSPLFVLDVNWIPTGHSVAQVAQRMFKMYGGEPTITTADDLARIIQNQ